MRPSLLLLACLVAACSAPSAATTVTPEPARPSSPGAVTQPAPPPSDEAPPPRPAPPSFPHGPTATARLQARLDAALASPETRSLTTGLRIVDALTGTVIARHDDERALVPASNTKLYTAFTALRVLGAGARAKVRVSVAGAHKAKGRAEALVLDAAATPFGPPLAALEPGLARVASALLQRGIRRVDHLVITSTAVVAPERFAELDLAVHRDRTASAVRKVFGRAGVAIGRLADAASSPSEPLLELEGPTVAEWITPMNRLSHNGLADALSMHLGALAGPGPSLAGGAEVVARELERAGVSGATLTDGSGLSRKNHVTARSLTDLLLLERGDDAFVSSLAVSGESGTLTSRLKDGPLAGRVRGKTGTLKEVIATSGYLDHPVDGRRYAFAIVTNGVQEGGGPNVRAAHDRWLSLVGAAWWE